MTDDADRLIQLWSEVTPINDIFKKYDDLNVLINECDDHILNGRSGQLNKTVDKMTDLSREIRKDHKKHHDLFRLCLKILYD